jgi:hypothetical protein
VDDLDNIERVQIRSTSNGPKWSLRKIEHGLGDLSTNTASKIMFLAVTRQTQERKSRKQSNIYHLSEIII